MSTIHSDVEALKALMGDIIENVMKTDGLETVKMKMTEAITEHVYGAYESPAPRETRYERRMDDGGLIDPENIDMVKYERTEDTHVMTVKNLRTGYKGRNVADTVERGTGYTWQYSQIALMQPYPRPFYEATDELLESSDIDDLLFLALNSI